MGPIRKMVPTPDKVGEQARATRAFLHDSFDAIVELGKPDGGWAAGFSVVAAMFVSDVASSNKAFMETQGG